MEPEPWSPEPWSPDVDARHENFRWRYPSVKASSESSFAQPVRVDRDGTQIKSDDDPRKEAFRLTPNDPER